MDQMIYSIVSVKKKQRELNTLLVGMKGVSGADLYAVFCDEITAVVSNIKRTSLVADRSNAMDYARVIETLAQKFTLLPVRFGSVMESTEMIIRMLGRNYDEIQSNLRKVENKVEFGLKVLCDSEKIKAELRAKAEAGTITEPALASQKSIYKDYLYEKLKEHRFEELLLAQIDTIIQDITNHFAHLKPIHKFQKMATTTNIIDDVFLLEKEKKDILIQAVEDLQTQYADLHLLLTGPWPPYNFVDLTIK